MPAWAARSPPSPRGGKANEAKYIGARHVVNSRKQADLRKIAGSLDLLLVTGNVPLDWAAMIGTLRRICCPSRHLAEDGTFPMVKVNEALAHLEAQAKPATALFSDA